jgi:hypothetical protein
VQINRQFFTISNETTVSVTSASTTVATAKSTRSFLYLANDSSLDVSISLGQSSTAGKGLYLPSGSAYEFSSQYGNLFQGDVFASLSGTTSATIRVVEGTGW